MSTYYYSHIVPLLRFQSIDRDKPALWVNDEENRILGLYRAGKTPTQIQKAFPQRTVAAIKLKLARLKKKD